MFFSKIFSEIWGNYCGRRANDPNIAITRMKAPSPMIPSSVVLLPVSMRTGLVFSHWMGTRRLAPKLLVPTCAAPDNWSQGFSRTKKENSFSQGAACE